MHYEEAKNIIQRIAAGTATDAEIDAVENFATRGWRNEGGLITLGHTTPRSSGQLWYPSVQAAIEQSRDLAKNWCDTVRFHRLLGLRYDGDGFYQNEVYEQETFQETVDFEPVVELRAWRNDDYETLVAFPCARGLIAHVADYEHFAEPRYLFSANLLPSCQRCRETPNLFVMCRSCLQRAIEAGLAELDAQAQEVK